MQFAASLTQCIGLFSHSPSFILQLPLFIVRYRGYVPLSPVCRHIVSSYRRIWYIICPRISLFSHIYRCRYAPLSYLEYFIPPSVTHLYLLQPLTSWRRAPFVIVSTSLFLAITLSIYTMNTIPNPCNGYWLLLLHSFVMYPRDKNTQEV